jgi:hypothetical protein
MTQRTVEDRLREEYFLLSSEIRRVLHQTADRCRLFVASIDP